jgi:hypothetical protein
MRLRSRKLDLWFSYSQDMKTRLQARHSTAHEAIEGLHLAWSRVGLNYIAQISQPSLIERRSQCINRSARQACRHHYVSQSTVSALALHNFARGTALSTSVV